MNAEYMCHMGDDLFVANVARVSFAKENKEFTTREIKQVGSDEGLIEYLAKHNHWTPFGHPQITLKMQAPVPIRTQCFKHKAGFVENEESRRYITSTPEVFVPEFLREEPKDNKKQGSGGIHPQSEEYLTKYKESVQKSVDLYCEMVNNGVCTEQARFVLPQGAKVNWIWTGSLAAYARFYGLRVDSHAQKEVQELAIQVGDIISPLFPYSWKALTAS